MNNLLLPTRVTDSNGNYAEVIAERVKRATEEAGANSAVWFPQGFLGLVPSSRYRRMP
jgi:hypothetical protein